MRPRMIESSVLCPLSACPPRPRAHTPAYIENAESANARIRTLGALAGALVGILAGAVAGILGGALVKVLRGSRRAPQFKPGALPAEVRSEPVAWLYDELDVDHKRDRKTGRRTRGLTLLHDILLSNGWEIRLRFYHVSVTRPAAVIPTAAEGGASPALVADSA
jgi:hypothetical protein